MAGALADASGAAPGTGTETLEGRTLIGEAGRDVQLIGRDRVVVLGIGDSRLERLQDGAGDIALGELEDLQGASHGEAADEVEDLAGLVRRRADVLDLATHTGALVGLCSESHQRRPFFS